MALGSADDGPYRLRNAGDITWSNHSAAPHRETVGQRIGALVRSVMRLVVPVGALLVALAAIYLYRDTAAPASVRGTESWLTVAHLLVPAAFFCIFLTNRRYGPAYAFAQVVLAVAVVVAAVVLLRDKIALLMPNAPAPSFREAVAFGSAFFVAGFVSIVAFDGARGAQWWTAPLFGFVSAAVVFALIFVPAAYADGGLHWVVQLFRYMGLLLGEGVLLLVPYWMLRRSVPPMSGFGGY